MRTMQPKSSLISLLQSFLYGGLKRLWVGTDNLVDLLAILEQIKCGHGTNAELCGYVGKVIYVDLDEPSLRICLGESGVTLSAYNLSDGPQRCSLLNHLRRNDFAYSSISLGHLKRTLERRKWATPRRIAVENHQARFLEGVGPV